MVSYRREWYRTERFSDTFGAQRYHVVRCSSNVCNLVLGVPVSEPILWSECPPPNVEQRRKDQVVTPTRTSATRGQDEMQVPLTLCPNLVSSCLEAEMLSSSRREANSDLGRARVTEHLGLFSDTAIVEAQPRTASVSSSHA